MKSRHKITIQKPEDAKKQGLKTHIVDAKNQPLGRIASRIALLLRGKDSAAFQRNRDDGGFVFVRNIDKLKFTGNKIDQKQYYKHSGYMGGLKETPLKKIFENNPKEVLKRAVFGMLPKNKLRALQIQRLKVLKEIEPDKS